MKKMLSLVLTLAMVLSLTTIAWAADPGTITNDTALQDAINSGATEVVLGEGEFTVDLYNIAARDSLTITGQGAATKLNFKCNQVRLELFNSFTLSNCTIGRMVNKSWGQLVFSTGAANGVYTVSNCIFNGESTQGIYFNPSAGNETYVIENCTFTGDFGSEGALSYQNNNMSTTLSVSGNTFNVTNGEKIAIHYHKSNLTLNSSVDETVLIKAGPNNDGTPTALENFQTAVETAAAGDTFKLMETLDLTNTPVEITTPITINANGKTLTGLFAGSNITTNANGEITSGVFAEDVTDYIAEGVEIEVVDNNWIVGNSINNDEEDDEEDTSEPTPAEIERDRVVAAIKVAEDGDTVVLNVKDTSVVSRLIADAMSGKNVNLEYALGEETVTVNGKNVPKSPAYRVWYSLELFSQFA